MTEKHETGLSGLHNLHKTLDDATEVLAAFISVTRSNEKAPDSLMEAADKAVNELAEWRAFSLHRVSRARELHVLPRLHSVGFRYP